MNLQERGHTRLVHVHHGLFGHIGRRCLDQTVQGFVGKGTAQLRGLAVRSECFFSCHRLLYLTKATRLPQVEPALAALQGSHRAIRSGVFEPPTDAAHELLHERHAVVVLVGEFFGFFGADVELFGQFADPHSIHHGEVDRLGLLAGNVGHLRDHGVEVHVGIILVALDELIEPTQRRAVLPVGEDGGEMDQDPWFLLTEINSRPLLTFFRQK